MYCFINVLITARLCIWTVTFIPTFIPSPPSRFYIPLAAMLVSHSINGFIIAATLGGHIINGFVIAATLVSHINNLSPTA